MRGDRNKRGEMGGEGENEKSGHQVTSKSFDV